MTLPPAPPEDTTFRVGPVLDKSALGEAVRQVLETENPDVRFVDRGGYVRVLAADPCHLDPAAVSALIGAPFVLPGDLERVMPAFRGRLTLASGRATWTLKGRDR